MAQCPSIRYVPGYSKNPGGNLPIYYCDVEVNVQIALAFVYIKCSFLNTSGEAIDGVFSYPATAFNNSTVCSCDITFGGKTFSSAVIDPEASKLEVDPKLTEAGKRGISTAPNDPKLFNMPFHGVSMKGEVVVELRFVKDLSFDSVSGDFNLELPMTMPANGLYDGRSWKEAMHYRISLASGVQSGGSWDSKSHSLEVKNYDEGVLTLEGSADKNCDLQVSYNAWSDQIIGSTIVQPYSDGNSGSFVTFLQPPSSKMSRPLPRKMVFLIDQSFSMSSGRVMSDALKATQSALDLLQPCDTFALCAYDHEENWYHGGRSLQSATSEAIHNAKKWVETIKPTGGTEILAPYKRATMLLQGGQANHHSAGGSGGSFGAAKIVPEPGPDGLPIIVIITDGAVGQDQDRALMSFAAESRYQMKEIKNQVRTFTFGIGPYCNAYALSQLADITQGYSKVCLDADHMEKAMSAFLSKTSSPVLAEIIFDFPEGVNVQTFPSTLPDLTCGAPLIVCGKYHGCKFPSSFQVRGRGMEGSNTQLAINSHFTDGTSPVHTLVEKARLDVLVGRWYICSNVNDKAALKAMAVKGSLQSSIPCVFTQAVAYENPKAYVLDLREKPPAGFVAPEGANVVDLRGKKSSDAHGKNKIVRSSDGSSGMGVAVGVGAAVVLATGIGVAFAFGNVSATGLNLGSSDAMLTLASDGFQALGGLCTEGWDAIGAVDWGSIGGGLGDAMKSVGDWGGGAIDTLGEFGGDAVGAIGGALGDVGEFAGDAVGAIGGVLEGAGDAAEGIGSCFCAILEIFK